ncbi:MAG: carbonic anhydrase family protein, partial [Rhodospirillales bacterium]|nr:carbonic anhydrase family protein [Rhodospirillales bacterium]
MTEIGPPGGRRSTANAATCWGYEPHNGPALWGTLDPTFGVCALGTEQSPIDLTGGRRAELAPVEFDYRRSRIEVENTGHTIQMNPEPGSGIVLDGVRHE